MSNLLKHAKRELALLGYGDPQSLPEDDPNRVVQENILELIETFAKQGHSGMSANYVIGVFFKLANFEPLKPLTGEDDEWEKIDFQTWQNIRCSRVFKLMDGRTFDIQGKIFQEPDGSRYANSDSAVDITFPYIPMTQVVHVQAKNQEGN